MDIEARWSRTEENEEGEIKPSGPVVAEAERYTRLRDQIFWRLREDLRLGRIGLPNDKGLFEELTAFTYEEPNGKIAILVKEKLRSRLGRSPDKADAVAYGNWVRPRVRRAGKSTDAAPEPPNRNEDHGLERLLARHRKEDKRQVREIERHLQRRFRLRTTKKIR